MKNRALVIVLTVLVVALIAVSAAWAATRSPAASARDAATPREARAWCAGVAGNSAAWKNMRDLMNRYEAASGSRSGYAMMGGSGYGYGYGMMGGF